MASLLNNASLLLNPAGSIIAYEEDKIFSVLPTNGAGDFTFSGGDGGTRVNQDGYIEQVPRNLITYSADFGYWTKDDSLTRTDNQPDPFGTNTAAKFSNNLGGGSPGNAYIYKSVNYIAGATYTFSLYIKGDSAGSITLRYDDSTTGPNYAVNYTTEWQRFSVTRTVNSTSGIFVLGGYSAWTPGENLTVAFAQHELYSTPRLYQPTTDRLNYPRITYQNGRGALLSEPQRANLNLYSQGFDNAYWNKQNASITASAGISPDGTNNAFKLNANATTNMHIIFRSNLYNGQAAVSVFAKKGEYDYFLFRIDEPATTVTYFNLANGTVGAVGSGHAAYIEPYKDGWYRCTTVFNKNIVNYCLGVTNTNGSSPALEADKGIYIWGSQVEAGTFPTSYIPTTSATVTRPLDLYSVTNLESKGLTGTNVGTLYLSVANIANSYGGGTINAKVGGGGSFPFNYMILDSTGTANRVRIFNGGAQTGIYYYDGFFSKIAVTADGTNSSVFVNGIKKGTSSGLLAGIEEITQEAVGAGLRYTTATYTTALSDAQCQELTTVNSGSGGTISYYGPYTIHTFTSSTTFTPSFNGQVEVLVVAGGGAGGGGDVGGGGGAGGLLYASSYGVSQGTGITVTIGSGGAGVANASLAGGNGSNSVFGGLNAIGGGGGAGWTKRTGNDGGSGGGSTYGGVGGSGIPGQGNNGGTGGILGPPYPQCGGGGAGEAGFPAQSLTVAGNGGDGLPYSISGFSTYYAGGGGGATEGNISTPGTPGTGGLGGGGNGGSQGASILGTPGVNGLGGGGGGCDPQAGANGGSGIVIVRYLT